MGLFWNFIVLMIDVCQIGKEREVAACLMQKFIDKGSELQIKSVIALDHLKNYIYIEADREAHAKEVYCFCENIFVFVCLMLILID